MNEFSKEYLESIGLMVVRFNLLEAILGSAITQAVHANTSLTDCLISGDSFSVLAAKLIKLLVYLYPDPKAIKESNKLYKDLDGINILRNNFIHTMTYINEKKEIVGTKALKRPNKKLEIGKELKLGMEQLTDLHNRINKAINDLLKLDFLITKLY